MKQDPAWLFRALALALLGLGLVNTAKHNTVPGLLTLGSVAAVLILTNRRISWQWHTAVLALLALVGLVYQIQYPDGFGWALALVITMRAFTRIPRWPAAILVGTAMIAFAVAIGVQTGSLFTAAEFAGGMIGLGALGNSIRESREHAKTLTRLLEAEQRSAAARAAAEALAERQRLARELHDVLGHTLSAQILRLEGVQLLLQRDADRVKVVEWVEQALKLARDGLSESKDALASLRGAVKPVREAIEELAAESEARFEVSGESQSLTPEVGLAVRRVAQEALTNVRRHAPGASVRVRLGFTADACTLEVTDTGAVDGHPKMSPGSGYGLTGMRERAELLGGKLDAGPCGSGFRVWLCIPF